jgi:hypothetical protein
MNKTELNEYVVGSANKGQDPHIAFKTWAVATCAVVLAPPTNCHMIQVYIYKPRG